MQWRLGIVDDWVPDPGQCLCAIGRNMRVMLEH